MKSAIPINKIKNQKTGAVNSTTDSKLSLAKEAPNMRLNAITHCKKIAFLGVPDLSQCPIHEKSFQS